MNDIILDNNKDLSIVNGDFDIGYGDTQHQLLIVLSEKGEFKEFPEVGVGIQSMLHDEQYEDLILEIKRQLEYDGMTVNDIEFTAEGKLDIKGKYK